MRAAAFAWLFLKRPARFGRATEAMAAVEFALVMPVMLAMYLGCAQLGDAVAITRKVTIATRSVADLTTQYASVSPTTLNTILSTAAVVVSPYALSNLVVTVSQVTTTDANGHANVAWSQSLNGTAYTVGQTLSLPAAGMAPAAGISLVLCNISYRFTPSIGYLATGPFTISDQIYMSPRVSSSISYTNS